MIKRMFFIVLMAIACFNLMACGSLVDRPPLEQETIDQLQEVTSSEKTFYKINNVTKRPGVDIVYEDEKKTVVVYEIRTNLGYRSPITALVGINLSTNNVIGILIIKQSETPGIGDRIVGNTFNMVGKSILSYQVYFTRISGATYSSNAVKDIFRIAYDQYIQDYNPAVNLH